MEASTLTTHVIDIHAADVAMWLPLQMSKLKAENAEVYHPQDGVIDRRVMEIRFPVSAEALDEFLRSVIPDLPKLGDYDLQILVHPGGAVRDPVARLTWTA